MMRKRYLPTGFALALMAAVGGCDESHTDVPERVVERDSAGVTVVENQRPAWAGDPEWRIGRDPVLEVGRDDPEVEFFNVVFAGGLSDGRMVIVDAGSRTIRWFDAGGAHLQTTGGAGEGPGEFRGITWAGVTDSDSLYVWDGQARRMTVYADQEVARDFGLQIPPPWGSVSIGGLLAGGSVVAMAASLPTGDEREGVSRPEVPAWIVSPDGEIKADLGTFPSAEVEFRPAATPGAVIRGVVPYGSRTVIAAAADWIAIGDSERYELALHDSQGGVQRVVRLPVDAEPVSDMDLQVELERRLEGAPPIEAIRDGIRANFEATPVPEFKPYFDNLLIDPAGYVWVRRAETKVPGEGARWDVVGRDGEWLGSLRVPAGLDVTQVTRESVMGVWTDEYGVESVRAFRLQR